MPEVGGNLGQRHKHKSPEVHSRVRHLELWRRDGFVTVQQNVQINESRAFGKFFLAAHFRFDFL